MATRRTIIYSEGEMTLDDLGNISIMRYVSSPCRHIKTFGVIPEIKFDATQLEQELGEAHYAFLLHPRNGQPADDKDCYIFNISLETMTGIAVRHQLTEFYFFDMRSKEKKFKGHHYERQDHMDTDPENPYAPTAKSFDFNPPIRRIKKLDTQIFQNPGLYHSDPSILDCIDEYPWRTGIRDYHDLL